jgi:hypothetical protein
MHGFSAAKKMEHRPLSRRTTINKLLLLVPGTTNTLFYAWIFLSNVRLSFWWWWYCQFASKLSSRWLIGALDDDE